MKPDLVAAHDSLSIVLGRQGKLDEAIAQSRHALSLDPDECADTPQPGYFPGTPGKTRRSAACFRRAIELMPDYAAAHAGLGDALKTKGKIDEAIACYRRALELKPDVAECHNNLGLALQAQGKLDEAILSFRQATELKPDLAVALLPPERCLNEPEQARRGGCLRASRSGNSSGTIPLIVTIWASRCKSRAGLTKPPPASAKR